MSTEVKENEVGKNFVIDADFDLSGETELRMVFIKPDKTPVTKLTADGVTAPAVPITVKVGTPPNEVEKTFEASTYWLYPSESGLLTPTGEWEVNGEYVDATPKDLSGDPSLFSVIPRNSGI